MQIVYTGDTKSQALEKANANLAIINNIFQGICNQNWSENPRELTANPVIDGNTYYYGFTKPPSQFDYGVATYDLEIKFSIDWFIQEEV